MVNSSVTSAMAIMKPSLVSRKSLQELDGGSKIELTTPLALVAIHVFFGQ
ncbi:hypothetical protein AFLA_009054 [Aspergillus flavus NRRL3357]|nr:hypothetical protein AFLA_009054 [Aspergillus flavus NRRL3357]